MSERRRELSSTRSAYCEKSEVVFVLFFVFFFVFVECVRGYDERAHLLPDFGSLLGLMLHIRGNFISPCLLVHSGVSWIINVPQNWTQNIFIPFLWICRFFPFFFLPSSPFFPVDRKHFYSNEWMNLCAIVMHDVLAPNDVRIPQVDSQNMELKTSSSDGICARDAFRQ